MSGEGTITAFECYIGPLTAHTGSRLEMQVEWFCHPLSAERPNCDNNGIGGGGAFSYYTHKKQYENESKVIIEFSRPPLSGDRGMAITKNVWRRSSAGFYAFTTQTNSFA